MIFFIVQTHEHRLTEHVLLEALCRATAGPSDTVGLDLWLRHSLPNLSPQTFAKDKGGSGLGLNIYVCYSLTKESSLCSEFTHIFSHP